MANYSDADIKQLRARAALLQEPTKRIEQAGGMVVPMSPFEGLSNMFRQGYASYLDRKATNQEKNKENALQDTLNNARVALLGRPAETDPETGISWNEQKPDRSAVAGILMDNPQTSDIGFKFAMDNQNGSSDTAMIRNYTAAVAAGFKGSFMDFLMQTKISSAGADANALGGGGINPGLYAQTKGMNYIPTAVNQPSNNGQPATYGPSNPALDIPQNIQPADIDQPMPKTTGVMPPPPPNVVGQPAITPNGGLNMDKINADAAAAGATKAAEQQAIADNAAEVEKQKVLGEAGGKAASDLPLTSLGAQEANELVDKILSSPGFGANFGLGSMVYNIPGGASANADALIQKLKDKSFLEAYQNSLRGSGAITEAEGQKATNALLGLKYTTDTATAKSLLNEFKIHNSNVLKLKAKKARGDNTPLTEEEMNGAMPSHGLSSGHDPLGIK